MGDHGHLRGREEPPATSDLSLWLVPHLLFFFFLFSVGVLFYLVAVVSIIVLFFLIYFLSF